MFLNRVVLPIVLSSLLIAPHASAGTYTDKLGSCILGATTAQDQQHFVEWIFSAIASHPSITPYANISIQKRDEIDKNVAKLLESLIGDKCKSEASDALKYEGTASFVTAFQLLGAASTEQLLTAPEVSSGMQGFLKYVDLVKLAKKIKPSQP
ncbi:hypothetical protein GTP45_17930 [Pseudoduganella sp. FT55W]|uniref:Uncharacterized protein n=1 Tax=Duganella rivi TaxID=2666083 RepID=A0A7X4GS90_9BURK|nr:hypothetical protein [Duganella rivi]MYM68698.1 hypothetical protein [Duganella rivi]